jgi:antitoxin (DNA-binding transcriptional repressor) of toxin-antitoxin stability system
LFSGGEIPITYIPATDAVVFRTSMLTRVAEGEEIVVSRRVEEQTVVAPRSSSRRREEEESLEQARRRSRSKSVERTQVGQRIFQAYSVIGPPERTSFISAARRSVKNEGKG